MSWLLTLVPEEAAPLLFVVAGLCLVIGLKRWAVILFAAGAGAVVLPPMLAPLIDELPAWVAVGALLLLGFALLRAIAVLLLGKIAANHMVGIMAASIVMALFRLPFSMLRWLFRRRL